MRLMLLIVASVLLAGCGSAFGIDFKRMNEFQSLDCNHDGALSYAECQGIHFTSGPFTQVLYQAAADTEQGLSYHEYTVVTMLPYQVIETCN